MMSDFKKWQYSAEKQTTMDDAIKVELECFIVCRARPMNPLKCSWNRNALNSRTSKASQPSYDSCVAWCRAGLSGNPPAESLHACSLSWTESFVSLSFLALKVETLQLMDIPLLIEHCVTSSKHLGESFSH